MGELGALLSNPNSSSREIWVVALLQLGFVNQQNRVFFHVRLSVNYCFPKYNPMGASSMLPRRDPPGDAAEKSISSMSLYCLVARNLSASFALSIEPTSFAALSSRCALRSCCGTASEYGSMARQSPVESMRCCQIEVSRVVHGGTLDTPEKRQKQAHCHLGFKPTNGKNTSLPKHAQLGLLSCTQ